MKHLKYMPFKFGSKAPETLTFTVTFYFLELGDSQSVCLYLISQTKNSKRPFGALIEGLSELNNYFKCTRLLILTKSWLILTTVNLASAKIGLVTVQSYFQTKSSAVFWMILPRSSICFITYDWSKGISVYQKHYDEFFMAYIGHQFACPVSGSPYFFPCQGQKKLS